MPEGKGWLYGSLAAATTTNGGDALSLINPEGADLIITEFVLDVTTPATGAATVDAGIAADGGTSADTLLDGQDVGTAAVLLNNVDHQGTNGKAAVKWGSGQYLTITPSASLAGLVGNYYVHYRRT